MLVLTRKSPFTGKVNEMEMPLGAEEFETAFAKWESGTLLQDAFPTLSPELREFIKTGITPEEWDKFFGKGGPFGSPL